MDLDAYFGNADDSDVMWGFCLFFFFLLLSRRAGEDSCVDNERHVAC